MVDIIGIRIIVKLNSPMAPFQPLNLSPLSLLLGFGHVSLLHGEMATTISGPRGNTSPRPMERPKSGVYCHDCSAQRGLRPSKDRRRGIQLESTQPAYGQCPRAPMTVLLFGGGQLARVCSKGWVGGGSIHYLWMRRMQSRRGSPRCKSGSPQQCSYSRTILRPRQNFDRLDNGSGDGGSQPHGDGNGSWMG